MNMTENPFEIGNLYDRRRDIHAVFGGQQQGGIATPAESPFIFLFTGESGEQYGYRDGWSKDGIYLYTGEGQIGDMTFVRGNRAVRDHIADGKDLLVFEALGKAKPYRYVGTFSCASWDTVVGPDKNGSDRKVIRFHLMQAGEEDTEPTIESDSSTRLSLSDLRERALAASRTAPALSAKESRANYYARSAAVRAYVLARAADDCECCNKPAPFKRKDGTPYLEPHHTQRLSDGGPDDPRWVAGICPTCHRRIHHGFDGEELNVKLQARLQEIERFAPDAGAKRRSAGALT